MKKITAHGHLQIVSDETEIRLSAGDRRMVMDIQHQGKRMPIRTFRRALAYREFLRLLDMPVLVYVNRQKILKLNGKKIRVYKPLTVFGWFVRDLVSI